MNQNQLHNTIIEVPELDLLRLKLKRGMPGSARLHNVLQFLTLGKIPKTAISFYSYGNPGDNKRCIYFGLQKMFFGEHYYTFYEPGKLSSEFMLEFASAFQKFVCWTIPNQFGEISKPLSDCFVASCNNIKVEFRQLECRKYVIDTVETPLTSLDTNNNSNLHRSLTSEDVEIVMKSWKFATERSRMMMIDCIENIGSIGIYNFEDKLISWCLLIQSGNIFSLQTSPDCRGKGYGTNALARMCEFCKLNAIVPVTFVETYNSTAMKLMERSGFKYVSDIIFLETLMSKAE